MVYYAGHGIEVDGTNYLVPADAKLVSDFDIEDETVSLDRVLKAKYDMAMARYALALEEWTAQGKDKDPADKPIEPVREHFAVIDFTIERLAEIFRSDSQPFLPMYLKTRADYDRGDMLPSAYWRKFAAQVGAALDEQTIGELRQIDKDMWSRPNQPRR